MNFNSLRKEINSRNSSVKELINEFFSKIDSKDPEINSYICLTKDNAIAQAENIDKLIQNKENILFCGSYFGYGFHEDGLKSSIEMMKSIND